MTYESFNNRLVISAKLVAVTPIFIGARSDSFNPGAVNGACVKDAYGRPYIPGSSLKGVLRAFFSAVFDEPIVSRVEEAFGHKEQRDAAANEYDKDGNLVKNNKKLADEIYKCSTKVERLFGSAVMAGKIKIADAVLVDSDTATEVRNGVAIDRDTHTAIGGALFETEAVPSGTAFNFKMSAENLADEEIGWLGDLIEYFAQGNLSVGGRSRAGLGGVELRDISVKGYKKKDNGFPAEKSRPCGDDKIKNNEIKKAVRECLND